MSEGDVIRVMIVDDVADTCDQLEKLLFFEKDIQVIAKAHNGRQAVEAAKKHNPDVILMDINMPEMDGIAATEAITADNPNIQVIIMSVQGETDYLRRAMLAGAREFLIKPVGADDLYKSIRHVHKLGASRPKAVAASASEAPAEKASTARGQLIAVFSPKGGVGTSVLAANMAVALRQYTKKKVALVDANLALGDQNVILNLISPTTIVDLSKRINDLDRDLLYDVLVSHNSEVKVLLAPPNPQEGETVTFEHLKAILDLMLQEFDYVIVDTQSSFHDKSLAVLDNAHRIVLIMTLEMPCIKNIKQFFEIAELLEYDKEKMLLVLNKADGRLGIRVDNVENNIQHKVARQIGNAEFEMTLSINQGVPLVISKRDHRVSRDIFALAREVSGIAQTDEEEDTGTEMQVGKGGGRRGGLGGLFKRLYSFLGL